MVENNHPLFSIVVTCSSRLHHLKQTLPHMLEQKNSEVIVVDYGCPQGAARWAKENYSDKHNLKVLEIKEEPTFWLSRARNIGAKNASAKFLCFVDVDIILEKDLCEWAASNVEETSFYLSEKINSKNPAHVQIDGCCIVSKNRFDQINGYDEAFRGWGHEDGDLYERLHMAGLNKREFPVGYVTPIQHEDNQRQLGEGSGGCIDKRAALHVGGIYRAVKYDMTRLTGKEPSLQERKNIMEFIKNTYSQAYARKERAVILQFPVFCHRDHDRYASFQRNLAYRLLI